MQHIATDPPASDPLCAAFSMTVKHACVATNFSKDLLYALINTGEVRSFLMGHRRYIEVESLRAYIARRSSEPLQRGRSPNLRGGPQGERARTSARKPPRRPPT